MKRIGKLIAAAAIAGAAALPMSANAWWGWGPGWGGGPWNGWGNGWGDGAFDLSFGARSNLYGSGYGYNNPYYWGGYPYGGYPYGGYPYGGYPYGGYPYGGGWGAPYGMPYAPAAPAAPQPGSTQGN